MNTHADKTQENKSRSVVNTVSQKKNGEESTFQFVDNQPEAIAQRKLQEMAKNSPQAKQAVQLKSMADNYSAQQQEPIQKKENNTSLPDNLKSGIENLSGYSMDDVKVHYNSSAPQTQGQRLDDSPVVSDQRKIADLANRSNSVPIQAKLVNLTKVTGLDTLYEMLLVELRRDFPVFMKMIEDDNQKNKQLGIELVPQQGDKALGTTTVNVRNQGKIGAHITIFGAVKLDLYEELYSTLFHEVALHAIPRIEQFELLQPGDDQSNLVGSKKMEKIPKWSSEHDPIIFKAPSYDQKIAATVAAQAESMGPERALMRLDSFVDDYTVHIDLFFKELKAVLDAKQKSGQSPATATSATGTTASAVTNDETQEKTSMAIGFSSRLQDACHEKSKLFNNIYEEMVQAIPRDKSSSDEYDDEGEADSSSVVAGQEQAESGERQSNTISSTTAATAAASSKKQAEAPKNVPKKPSEKMYDALAAALPTIQNFLGK